MIKKVVIFAAGRGTRMLDLAKNKPKHLLEIFGKPFLFYLLTNLTQAGFEEIIMITGHLSEQLDEFIDSYERHFPFFKTINQFSILGEDKYGTLMPLLAVREQIEKDNFVVVMGDNLYDISDLKYFRSLDDDLSYIGGLTVTNPTAYGTLVGDGDRRLVRIDEKSSRPVSDIINTGIYKFAPEIFQIVDEIAPAPNGEYQITDAISLLAQQGRVKIEKLNGYWLDFGKPQDIVKMEKFIESKNLFKTYGIKK